MSAEKSPAVAALLALLTDPTWQTPLDTALLPHLLAFGPPERHVHLYSRQGNGTTACTCGQVLGSDTAAAWPAKVSSSESGESRG